MDFRSVRGSVFFRNPDAAMAPVFARLADLEIEALGPASESEKRTDSPLIERIRRSAEALRARWLAGETATGDVEGERLPILNKIMKRIFDWPKKKGSVNKS